MIISKKSGLSRHVENVWKMMYRANLANLANCKDVLIQDAFVLGDDSLVANKIQDAFDEILS